MAFDLDRFVHAQVDHYDTALAELRAGTKRSHWMWYIFPQLAGLGHSATARHYAIRDLEEARAYLAHPVLGPRYLAAVAALRRDRSAKDMLGTVDAMKLRSSLTLFAHAGAMPAVSDALSHYFAAPDAATLALL